MQGAWQVPAAACEKWSGAREPRVDLGLRAPMPPGLPERRALHSHEVDKSVPPFLGVGKQKESGRVQSHTLCSLLLSARGSRGHYLSPKCCKTWPIWLTNGDGVIRTVNIKSSERATVSPYHSAYPWPEGGVRGSNATTAAAGKEAPRRRVPLPQWALDFRSSSGRAPRMRRVSSVG